MLAFAGLVSSSAQAAIITVGTPVAPGQCSYATIQEAFNAADTNAGTDTVRITRSLLWTAQNARLNVKPNQETIVEGGYATCTQASADATLTTISGLGGSDDSVLEIRIGTGGIARLRNLIVTRGDDVNGSGGGIEYIGNGVLELSNFTASFNRASRGAGIFAEATGTDAELVLGPGVTVFGNQAGLAGGGLFVDGVELTIDEDNTVISANTALNPGQTAYGGGLYLTGHDGLPGIARIGAPGAVITSNEADHGGGVALRAVADGALIGSGTEISPARLFVASRFADRSNRIVGNRATVRGGAIYARYDVDLGFGAEAEVSLDGGTEVSGNVAPVGAAVYLDYDSSVFRPDGGARLFARRGRFLDNRSETAVGVGTSGAIIHATSATSVDLGRVELRGNVGGPVLRIDSDEDGVSTRRVSNSLIVGNASTSFVIHTLDRDGSRIEIRDSTIAGNAIGGNAVLAFNDDSVLANLIIAQPGKLSLTNSGGTPTITHIVASEGASLGAGPTSTVFVGDPRFMDPDNGDYRVQASSPAIDRAPGAAGEDLDGYPRGVDLPVVIDVFGPRDVGAYERQTVGNLVRNASFGRQLQLWARPPGVATFTTIVEGDSANPQDTRSALVKLDPSSLPVDGTLPGDGRVFGVRQCVRLPGSANYLLSAAAKSPGTMVSRDEARLNWRFHQNSADCSGTPTREGEFALPSGNGWATSNAGTIPIAAGEVGSNSTLAITLIAQEGNITAGNAIDAYFDAISLTVGDLEVPIPPDVFHDGFEQP